MASAKQKQQIAALNALMSSQQRAQAVGLPAFATPVGQQMTPAQAAAAGASPGLAAQFAPGTPPVASQPLNRKQKLAQIGTNVSNAVKAPAPGKGKAVAALVGGVGKTPQAQQQLTTTQQARIIAREVQRVFRGASQNTGNFLSGLSTPGDIWFPVLVLLTLMFVLVPVTGADGKAHTRLGWLWLALIGQAHIEGEVLTQLTPAGGETTSGPVIPGNQVQGTPGLTNQQKCIAGGGTWNGPNQTEGNCTYPQGTGTPQGSGGVTPVMSYGNATLTLEDYL